MTGKAAEPLTLRSRNIRVRGHRTNVNCDERTWSALGEIALIENMSLDEVCTNIADNKPSCVTLADAMRVFAIAYFRSQCQRLAGGMASRLN